ncbi:hypothetical protein DL1_21105 [Thioclava dalianensis]|uniref:DUF6603 domain-containing protein n=1 Tax=Thioclava dalianensis TaxID=1185766 RepID=A0A074TE02_9RHOB|nr:DUF6603 domain-containing protein [Thioclava dalianensis]KEP70001.1 hypothetical protein DL1_21105 [Thioclava dalianensis]SFN18621.1 hypothetical protein SAMN05216224_102869 [Thioclava dalianensis]
MSNTLDQLEQTLKAAVQPDGSLALTGSLLGAPDLGDLIAQLEPSGSLVVQDAEITLSGDKTTLTVSGKTDIGELKGAAITVSFTQDSSATLEMTARITLPDGTALAQLLSPLGNATLKALKLDGGAVILSSLPYQDAGTGRSLAPGLNLSATIDPIAVLPYLGAILPAHTQLAMAGPITDFALPLFDLTTREVTGSLIGVSLPALYLQFTSASVTTPPDEPAALGQAFLAAQMTVGGVTGTVRAPLPDSGMVLALEVEFEGLTLSSFEDLAVFIGNVDPFSALPAPIQTQIKAVTDSFALRSLGLSVDLSKPAFLESALGVSVDLQDYAIFNPIPALKVQELDLSLKVNTTATPTVITFGASTTLTVGSSSQPDSFQVLIGFQTQSSGSYQISATQEPGTVLKLSNVVQSLIPSLTGFPDFDVTRFGLLLLPDDGTYSFDAVIQSDWEVLSTPSITLSEVDVSALYNRAVTPSTSGAITGIFTLDVGNAEEDQILITLSAVKPEGTDGWKLAGQTGEDQAIPIGNLIEAITHEFDTSVELPEFLADMVVENLDLTFDTAQKAFHFGTEIQMPFSDDVVLTLTVSLDVQPKAQGTGYETTFRGTIQIAQYQFDIVFDAKTAQSDTLIATYQPASGSRQSVTLKELLAGISESLAQDIPVNIEIDLKDVKFVFYKDKTNNRMAFGLDVGIPIDLSDIPIVGSRLPPELTLAITNLQGVYATKAFAQSDIAGVNGLLPSGVVPFPKEGLGQGVNLAADVRIGDWTERFQLAGAPSSKTQPSPTAARMASSTALTPSAAPQAAAPAAGDDSYMWLNINKQIGIFQFDRIGAGYSDNLLSLALDAGITLGPLSFSMLGLSVGSPMDKFAPEFGLNGLGLSFNQPPINLSGGFMKVKDATGTSYYGQVVAEIAQIGFSALGGWSPDADPASFFLYANIDIPMGGPPYLQLKALAGGIGINRSLLLPTIEELPGYILLPNNAPPAPGTPQSTVATVLPQLEKYLVNQPGQYWVAAGIAFSSFEMIEAFALVTVSFGVDFQLGILGSLSATVPAQGEEAIAYIEVDMVASFAPASGLLSVEGAVSPRSFVFGGFVKIQGGFAFRIWFAKENAGDFVASVGGYYPSFDKPAHYPTVPRLKIGYALGPLSVSGTAYFALTPALLMAGIKMNAVFEAGPIKAWFDAGFDILIAWQPFQYQAGTYVSIGVAVDIGLFTLKLQAGADLLIWGPEFGGKADVDLDVVSFSIAFGAAPSPAQPVGWSNFRDSFLPPDSPAPKAKAIPAPQTALMRATPALEAQEAPQTAEDPGITNILKIMTKTGLVSTAMPGYDAIISPTAFSIEITSTMPANSLSWAMTGGEIALQNTVADWSTAAPVAGTPFLTLPKGTATFSDTQVWNPVLDVAPMGKTGITSAMKIAVLKHLDSDAAGEFSDAITDLQVAPMLMASSTALWKLQDVANDPNLPALLEQTLVGLSLTPVPRAPTRVSDVPLIELLFTQGNNTGFYPASAQVVPGYQISTQNTPPQDLTIQLSGTHQADLTNTDYHLEALVDPWVASQRSDIATALREAGFGTYDAAQIDLTTMATRKALTDWPVVRQLGA